VDGTHFGLCPVMGFGITGTATRELVLRHNAVSGYVIQIFSFQSKWEKVL
jgi:hypothetical protein